MRLKDRRETEGETPLLTKRLRKEQTKVCLCSQALWAVFESAIHTVHGVVWLTIVTLVPVCCLPSAEANEGGVGSGGCC